MFDPDHKKRGCLYMRKKKDAVTAQLFRLLDSVLSMFFLNDKI